LGHSLGGVVAVALAARSSVEAVVGLGIKVAWSDEELDRARALAQRPVALFGSRDEAVARYLRVSGLVGLLAGQDPAVQEGIREQDGRWRLALDPRVFGVGAPDLAGLVARSSARVSLARGEHDTMNSDEQLARLGVPVVTLAGLGHNAHVESPQQCMTLLEAYC
jgi:pimeloyl-ACP methyl ester carboxylesterase